LILDERRAKNNTEIEEEWWFGREEFRREENPRQKFSRLLALVRPLL